MLNTGIAWVDIVIQIEKLRHEAERLFPMKIELFNLVYITRLRRLWEQWRTNRAVEAQV